MKPWVIALVSSTATAILLLAGIFIPPYLNNSYVSPLGRFAQIEENPLEKYSLDRLKEYVPEPSQIQLEGVITQEDSYTSYLFSYITQGKKVTGQLNKPKTEGPYPVVVMIRGFVDPSLYQTGIGTRNAAAVFSSSGYLTVAPDFLGYGESDPPEADSFAARVQRPITVLDLIASIKQFEDVDPNHLFLWGHSNGGQISLSILEITGESYPTTLWAPVTKPFPYSILFYTDEYADYGKDLRKALATFESIYDVDKYSITTYLDRIKAPLQIHQGGVDDAVPIEWSDEFVSQMKQVHGEDLSINYFRYPQADHNLRPSWNTVVERDLVFFNSFLDN